MDPCNDLTFRLLESLSQLSPDDQARALNELLGKPIKGMTIYRVLEIRCAIVEALDPEVPIVAAALDLIDGQIALREIAAGASWR
jgi:hypothetical protein